MLRLSFVKRVACCPRARPRACRSAVPPRRFKPRYTLLRRLGRGGAHLHGPDDLGDVGERHDAGEELGEVGQGLTERGVENVFETQEEVACHDDVRQGRGVPHQIGATACEVGLDSVQGALGTGGVLRGVANGRDGAGAHVKKGDERTRWGRCKCREGWRTSRMGQVPGNWSW